MTENNQNKVQTKPITFRIDKTLHKRLEALSRKLKDAELPDWSMNRQTEIALRKYLDAVEGVDVSASTETGYIKVEPNEIAPVSNLLTVMRTADENWIETLNTVLDLLKRSVGVLDAPKAKGREDVDDTQQKRTRTTAKGVVRSVGFPGRNDIPESNDYGLFYPIDAGIPKESA